MDIITVVVEAKFRSNKQVRAVIAELEKRGFVWNSDWGVVTTLHSKDHVWILGTMPKHIWHDLESVEDVVRIWEATRFTIFGPVP